MRLTAYMHRIATDLMMVFLVVVSTVRIFVFDLPTKYREKTINNNRK